MKFLYRENELDYYMNDRGKVECVPDAEFLSYRINELSPECQDKLAEAWKLGRIVWHSTIDAIIKYQDEAPEKALAYIGYRLLGTHRHCDVFGDASQAEWNRQQHEAQTCRMEEKMDMMQKQLIDMQQLMLNLAQQDNVRVMRRTG